MRKEQLKLRTEGNGSAATAAAPLASDDSDIENESINKEQTTSDNAFDDLLAAKPSDTPPSKKANGVTKGAPSPIPDDSDTEKNDTENDEAEAETSTLNETAVDKTDGDDNETGNDDEKEENYEVEAIVGTRVRGKKTLYHIKWKNYPDDQNSWETESNIDCPELIEEYLEKNPPKGKKEKTEKKVRISLPASRETPKRAGTESKSLAESDQESDDSPVEAKTPKKKPSKSVTTPTAGASATRGRGRPKKAEPKLKAKPEPEYEVEKIIDEEMRFGKKYYRIRWKGYGAKDDTWQVKTSLHCPDKIKEYENSKEDDEAEYEVEKIMGEKIEKGERYFLVKWKNWPENSNSWELANDVDCDDLIEKFRDSCRSTVAKPTKRPAKSPIKTQTPKKAKKSTTRIEDDDDDDDERDPLADDDENNDGKDDDDETEKQWEVQKILDERKRGGKKEYLIRWKNCDQSQDTWEPEKGINCPDLLAAFAKKKNK